MIGQLAPELATRRPGALTAARLPHLKTVIRMGTDKSPGMFNFDEVCGLGGPAQQLRLDAITRRLIR